MSGVTVEFVQCDACGEREELRSACLGQASKPAEWVEVRAGLGCFDYCRSCWRIALSAMARGAVDKAKAGQP